MGGSNRGATLQEARAAAAELRRLDYQRRKAEGRCTRRGCKAPAAPGSGMCAACGPVQYARVNATNRARRAKRRDAGQCIECGAKSPTCRCVDCQIRLGMIARRALSALIGERNRSATLVTTIEKDPRYPEGRVRTRYRGAQGRRGAPSREAADVADLALAVASLRRAMEKLEHLCNVSERRERQAARDAALGQVALAGRMLDEVLDRDGYEQRMRRR